MLALFCQLIAENFKKLAVKWIYEVFMTGGAFFMGHPVKSTAFKIVNNIESY